MQVYKSVHPRDFTHVEQFCLPVPFIFQLGRWVETMSRNAILFPRTRVSTIQSQHQSPKACSLSVQFEVFVFHPHIQKQTVQLINLVEHLTRSSWIPPPLLLDLFSFLIAGFGSPFGPAEI